MFEPRLRQSEIFRACAPYVLSGCLHSRFAGAAQRRFGMAGAERQHRIRALAFFYERPMVAKSARTCRIRHASELPASPVSGTSGIALAQPDSRRAGRQANCVIVTLERPAPTRNAWVTQ